MCCLTRGGTDNTKGASGRLQPPDMQRATGDDPHQTRAPYPHGARRGLRLQLDLPKGGNQRHGKHAKVCQPMFVIGLECGEVGLSDRCTASE